MDGCLLVLILSSDMEEVKVSREEQALMFSSYMGTDARVRRHPHDLESESECHSVLSDSLRPHGLYSPWNSPGLNTGVGSCSLLQQIFLTQGSNRGLSHYRCFFTS